jgi:hypothetical protein
MPITLIQALDLLSDSIGANKDGATEINLVCERYLNSGDPPGSLELVTFIVTADSNGQGFITLPDRYQAIRGAVETTIANSLCLYPLEIRNGWYEFAPGNLGMLKSSDPMRGIIPITKSAPTDPVKYKVPVCPTPGSNAYFTCICKLAFQILEGDDAILPIQNIGALKLGLKALAKEDAEDYVRAKQLWDEGKVLLAEQKDNETGAEAYGKVQFDDDFQLANLGSDWGSPFWYGW